MNRRKILILLGLVTAMAVAGCGNSADEVQSAASAGEAADAADADDAKDADLEDTDAEDAKNAVLDDTDEEYTEALYEDGTEAALASITPSDYLVDKIDSYVTLGDLSGLAVTEYVYEITDDLVQEEIDMDLYSYADEIEVDRASAQGDVVYAEMTYSIEGAEDSEVSETTYFTVGEEEYNAEFDEAITGVSAGDTVTFSITFDDDIWMDEWVDETVDFELEITSVCELEYPEYDDDFVSTYTDYSTTEEYEASIRKYLEEEYNESSRYEAIESLFDSAMQETVFTGYPDDLYEQCREEQLAFYSVFTGTTDEEDIYDLFGDLTEEDFEDEIVSYVYRDLFTDALIVEYDLDISEDAYVEYLTELAGEYGYDSAAELEEESGRDSLVWSFFDTVAGNYLYENADVTQELTVPDEDDEDNGDEDDVLDVDLDLELETEGEA